MKKALFISMLILVGGVAFSWSLKDSETASNTANKVAITSNPDAISNNASNGPANGTYNASGKITFTAGGINYSCSISKVIVASTSITIQTSNADVKTSGSLVITCYTAKSAITTGTYTASSPETISSVTFIDKTVTPFTATSMTTGSGCSVNITTLTATTIKGTFIATVITPLDKKKLSITGGVIDCTIKLK